MSSSSRDLLIDGICELLRAMCGCADDCTFFVEALRTGKEFVLEVDHLRFHAEQLRRGVQVRTEGKQ